ncbi:MAG: hypothetical protein H6733_00055 [Alphaproteobacteria bacterium]|nr:hypothetical protein [Alphaproteobacteria bacterium]
MRPVPSLALLLLACDPVDKDAGLDPDTDVSAADSADSADSADDSGADSPSESDDTLEDDTSAPPGELSVWPGTLRFGDLPPGCPGYRTVTLQNVGGRPLAVHGLRLVGGDTTAFLLDPFSATTIRPGERLPLTLAFSAPDLVPYPDTSLEILGPLDTVLATLPLDARGRTPPVFDETFVQGPAEDVDVLLLVDPAHTSTAVANDFRSSVHDMVDRLTDLGVSFRIAVATTDDGAVCASLSGPYVSEASEDAAETLRAQLRAERPDCTQSHAFGAMQSVLGSAEGEAMLRPSARLAVVVVSDVDDATPGTTPSDAIAWLTGLKGGDLDRVTFHAYAGQRTPKETQSSCSSSSERSAEASPRYHAVADATAGVTVDSCRVSADVLTLGATVRATGMTHRFPLSHAPLDGELEVVRDGPSVLNWVWSTVGNQLEFRRDPVPLPGEEFRVRYDYAPTCRR